MKNIKKTISLFLALVLAVALCACNASGDKGATNSAKFDPTDPSIYTIDVVGAMQAGKSLGLLEERKEPEEVKKAADDLLKEIEEFPDTVKAKEGSKTYYVANDGDDNNDGLSPEKPLKTIHAASIKTKSGDAVLLKRGDFWREAISGRDGVSYGAYGKGNKPTLYGSIDGLSLEWEQDEENENIWKVDVGTSSDIGLMIFDHGKAFGNKKNKLSEVIQNYNFYFEKRGTTVYLYYDKGNPTEDFYSIEIGPDVCIVTPGGNSTIQNLRLMYTGGFGVSYGYKDEVMLQGLVIGYIGGSYMSGTVRYGNGVQLWASCDGHYIDHCHVYQCYDAGITPQFLKDSGTADVTEKNIKYTNNLLEYSVYNIEYFLHNTTGEFSDVEFSNNILRYAGYGWGTLSRPNKTTPANIQGGNSCKSENFVIKDNIFVHGYPRLIRIENTNGSAMPVFSGNTYIVNKTRNLFVTSEGTIAAKNSVGKTAEEIFGDKTGTLIIY